jgi:hypothetical protein
MIPSLLVNLLAAFATSQIVEKAGHQPAESVSGADARSLQQAASISRSTYPAELLQKLLEQYRKYDLPLPPANAKLVRLIITGGTVNGVVQHYTHLAFLLSERGHGKMPVVQMGTVRYVLREVDAAELTFVAPKAELASQITGAYFWCETFDTNQELATAMQCQYRGWSDLAQALLQNSLGAEIGFGPFEQRPAHVSAKKAIAYMAVAYSANEVLEPNCDWSRIAKRMRAALEDEPELSTDKILAFQHSLEATLKPRNAKPGSTEALIDDLVDMEWDGRQKKALADLGLKAVPALLQHLDDPRLTRSIDPGMMMKPTYHLLVRDVVAQLLTGLAGEKTAKRWRRRIPDDLSWSWPFERRDVEAWWEQARKSAR